MFVGKVSEFNDSGAKLIVTDFLGIETASGKIKLLFKKRHLNDEVQIPIFISVTMAFRASIFRKWTIAFVLI